MKATNIKSLIAITVAAICICLLPWQMALAQNEEVFERNVPNIEISLYSLLPQGSLNQIAPLLGEKGLSLWGTIPSDYNNDKTIFIHIIDDGMCDEQIEIIWGKTIDELDTETEENQVFYSLKKVNQNDALLISAIDLDTVLRELATNQELKDLLEELKMSPVVKPNKEIIIPRTTYSVYSQDKTGNIELMKLLQGRGESVSGSVLPGYNNDKAIFLHLVNDNMIDTQSKIIWGISVKELDTRTLKEGVIYERKIINENWALLISAVNMNELKKALSSDLELQKQINFIKKTKSVTPAKKIVIPASAPNRQDPSVPSPSPVKDTVPNISIKINGENKVFSPGPVIKDGTTLVPMRSFFEALGCEVSWNNSTQTATGTRGDKIVQLTIGKKEALVNSQVQVLSVEAQLIEGSTYIPLRFVGEALGDTVIWDAKTRSIEIQQN